MVKAGVALSLKTSYTNTLPSLCPQKMSLPLLLQAIEVYPEVSPKMPLFVLIEPKRETSW
jgi:hypothetical protein